MGTNYYLHEKPPCPCCKREYEGLHIGKSSGGWCFGLHVIPEESLNTLEDWRKRFIQSEARILNEDGDEVSAEEMMGIICVRKSSIGLDTSFAGTGYKSEEKFHRINHSERGPNNLLRHQIDGERCIGHGEGTWDYIRGEFS